MKKTLIFLLFITSLISNSQTYYNFPDSNSIWNIYNHNVWSGNNTESKRYVFYQDTSIINGKTYSKLYDLKDDTTYLGLGISNLVALFREDSLKKVWCRFDTTDYLLYDFSLEQGDTIFHECIFYDGFVSSYNSFQIIDSIGNVLINGEERDIFYLSGGIQGNTWIEGIGAIDGEGLFAPIADICTCGDEYYLACFKENENVLYQNNPICNSCFCQLYENISIIETDKIMFYPNPANENINLLGGNIKNIRIYSITGKLLIETKSTEIDISNVKRGLYLIEITDNFENVKIDKLIINNVR